MRDRFSSGGDARPGRALTRRRISTDLESRGIARDLSQPMAARLAPLLKAVSSRAYGAALDAAAAAVDVARVDGEPREHPRGRRGGDPAPDARIQRRASQARRGAAASCRPSRCACAPAPASTATGCSTSQRATPARAPLSSRSCPGPRVACLRRLLPWLALAQIAGILLADQAIVSHEAALVLGAACLALGAVAARRPIRAPAARSAWRWHPARSVWPRALDAAARDGPSSPSRRRSRDACGRCSACPAATGSTSTGWAQRRPACGCRRRSELRGEATPEGVAAIERALPGERLRVRARLAAPSAFANPGGRERVRNLTRSGARASGRLAHPALHARMPEREGWRPLAGLLAARARLDERLARTGPGGALLRALALGERAGLSADVQDAFARLGLAHLLSVSGLHLALVAGLAFTAAHAALGRSAWLAARRDTRAPALAAGVAGALLYALLSGWQVPVRRSLLLVLALALAMLRGRRGRACEPLAAASLAILAAEPQALFGASFQLSFAASAALAMAPRAAEPASPRPADAPGAGFARRSPARRRRWPRPARWRRSRWEAWRRSRWPRTSPRSPVPARWRCRRPCARRCWRRCRSRCARASRSSPRSASRPGRWPQWSGPPPGFRRRGRGRRRPPTGSPPRASSRSPPWPREGGRAACCCASPRARCSPWRPPRRCLRRCRGWWPSTWGRATRCWCRGGAAPCSWMRGRRRRVVSISGDAWWCPRWRRSASGVSICWW